MHLCSASGFCYVPSDVQCLRCLQECLFVNMCFTFVVFAVVRPSCMLLIIWLRRLARLHTSSACAYHSNFCLCVGVVSSSTKASA